MLHRYNAVALTKSQLIPSWIFLLGATVPISVAAQNIVAVGVSCLLIARLLFKRELSFTGSDIVFFMAIIFFSCVEWVHDDSVSKTAKLLLVFFLLVKAGEWLAFKDRRALDFLLWGLSSGLMIGFGIDEYRRPEYALWATSGAKYANEAAFLAVVAWFLALRQPWKARLPLLGSLTLFIIMTGARAAMLGMVAGLAFYVFFHIRSRWAVAAFGVVSLVVVGLGTLPPQGSTLYRLHVNVDQARIDLWKNAWKLAKYDHFLGRGEKQFETGRGVLRACCPAEHPGHWEDILDAPSDSPEYYQNISFHNQIVQALVEYGLPGAAIMAVFLFFPFVCSIGKSWHLSVSGRYAMGIGLWVAFIVHNMFELGLYNSSAILMGFLAGYTGLFSDRGQRCDTNSVVQRDANA